MMKRRAVASIVLVALLAGCAVPPPRQLSREEWLATTTRTYADVDKETLISKAEKVLRLIDGDDFTIQHTTDGFSATRPWTSYAIIAAATGTDYWNFAVTSTPEGARANVQVSMMSSVIAPMMAIAPTETWTVTTGPVQGTLIDGNLLYTAFWARLDYLLGKTDKWLTCEDVTKMRRSGEAWGVDDPICNSFNIKDLKPD